MAEPSPELKSFTFYWLDGKKDFFQGQSPGHALTYAGYGGGALKALDFYADGDCSDYEWNQERRSWQRIHESDSTSS